MSVSPEAAGQRPGTRFWNLTGGIRVLWLLLGPILMIGIVHLGGRKNVKHDRLGRTSVTGPTTSRPRSSACCAGCRNCRTLSEHSPLTPTSRLLLHHSMIKVA